MFLGQVAGAALGACLLAAMTACGHSSDAGSTRREQALSPLPAEGCLAKECHRPIIGSPYLHAPVAEQPCGFCHRAVEGDHPEGLGMEFEAIMGRDRAFCMSCHPEAGPRPAFSHKPYNLRQCRECHEIHGSSIRPLMKRDINGLCSYCHRDIAARLENCRYVHGAVEEESCVDTCHAPHESDNPSLLRKEADELCLDCHDAPAAGSSHPFFSEGGCVGCHYPHAGNMPGMVRGG
jgi:predicted CXXCH cytochrome family protein